MFFIFISIFTLIISTGSIYAYSASLNVFTPWQRILLGAGTALGFIGVLMLSRTAHPTFILAVIYFLAWIVGGTILYGIILTPFLGIAGLIAYFIKKPNFRIVGTWILITVACTASLFGIYQRSWIKTTPYTLTTSEPALVGKRIAVIADPQFNIANNKQMARRITEQLEIIRPDLILLPGDIFDGATLTWEPLEQEFKKWSSLAPSFMIPGNHEEYGDYATFMELMRRNGITTLEDEMSLFGDISIVGFKYYGREKEAMGTKIITDFFESRTIKQPLIVMNHEPRYAELFAKYDADLVLHGHTHGGQFWPLKYIVRQVYGRFWYGLNTVGSTSIITSSGLGLAAFPSRLFNTPEIVLVTFIVK